MQDDDAGTAEIIGLFLLLSIFVRVWVRVEGSRAGRWQLARTATRICSLDEEPGSRGD
jgi:hypothetical protein